MRAWALCATFSFSLAGAAGAADVPIPGKVTVVKNGKITKFVARDTAGFALPSPGSAEDPTLAGAEIEFFDSGSGLGRTSYSLDASGWKGLGNPSGSKGYKYLGKRDSDDPDPKGACRVLILKQKIIKAVCKGASVFLDPPFAGSEGIRIGLPAGTASTVYCAEFGGTTVKNDEKLLKRKSAAAPASCPSPAIAFSGLDNDDVIDLADDSLAGRNNNTAGSTAAQQHIIDGLVALGAIGLDSGQSGEDAFKQSISAGTNILGLIPGGARADEYVMIGAHYDHVGSNCTSLEVGDTICNGATDNAAGVAATLAAGRAIANLPSPPKRSVILAFWDREEDGLLGSLHYVENPIVPIEDTVAYINFDIQGSNLLPSLKSFSFAVGAETGGVELTSMVRTAVHGEGLGTQNISYIFGQLRSDYANLVNAGVPTVFFSDSTGPCYHTSEDEVAVVDFDKLAKQTRIGERLALALIEADKRPSFSPPNPALATFRDAVTIHSVLTAALNDLALFDPADQVVLQQFHDDLTAIVSAGEAGFDNAAISRLLFGTLDLVTRLTQTTCDGFL